MMEIDRMSYIFGSFARRRQSQDLGAAKRRSIEPPPKPCHDRSKSAPHAPSPAAGTAAALDEGRFRCPVCQRAFVEPRVLPCLHTFCLRCLQQLETSDYSSWQDDDSGASANSAPSRKGSAGSGYVSDRNTSCSPGSPKRIHCPTCGTRADIPSGGVALYPPNYLLQHRMVLATLNAHHTRLLCDLCTPEVTATSRCMSCAINLCERCEGSHRKQRAPSAHEVLSLPEARMRGITKLRRQIMCIKHPETELSLFCVPCCQVICRDCLVSTAHKGHSCELVSRAVRMHLTNLRLAAEKAKAIAEQSALAANRLHLTSKKIEVQCSKVQTDVERFIDDYLKSVERHRRNLNRQIGETRQQKLQEVSKYRSSLHGMVKEARDVVHFLDELLADGSDVEIMTFLKPVMDKVEYCVNLGKAQDLYLHENIQFLPEEAAQIPESPCLLYGLITAQTVSPAHCALDVEGLQNLRVGKKTKVHLETRDRNNTKLERGGEQISAEIRYRDAGVSRFLNVDIDDKRDGTYIISFVPDVAGKLVLNVNIKNQSIQGNPFPFLVKTLKPHHGTFHCCSFCSSGGSKEASCGCDGKMPGGYKGCGHGHDGHPGRRHWSCCGNILEHSECGKPANSHYQFTL